MGTRVASALVRTKLDVVDRRVSESIGVIELWTQLNIATTALNLLLALCLVLDEDVIVVVAEVSKCAETPMKFDGSFV